MSLSPRAPSPDRSTLLLEFPVRLYTALRTMRLYPAANPQVQRSNDFVLKAFKALLAGGTEDSVNLAISEQKILVCGEHLADKDQQRPQIQGLVTLLNRLKIHSFSFHPSFDFTQCEIFIQSLADLFGEKELSEPLVDLFTRTGLHAVSVDAKRYVAVHKGEQVVREEMIGAGLNISDEELANFVLGTSGQNGQPRAIAPELIEELISRLPKSAGDQGQSADLSETVLDLLEKLSREIDFGRQTEGINQSATALTNLDPALLAGLVAEMPATAVADAVLDSTLDKLSPAQRNTLIANLVARLPVATAAGTRDQQRQTGIDVLERLAGLQGQNGSLQQIISRNIDAHVLQAPLEQGAALPEQLVMRLQQPSWSAPVLVSAAQQSLDPSNYKDGKADFSSFERMLAKYDSLLNKEKQLQVAAQAGRQLAAFDEQELGLILVQKYKNLFGDQLYQQVISQLSDEKFTHLANQLQTFSLDRKGLPLDLDDKEIEDAYNRLLQTVRGEKMRAILAMHKGQQEHQQEKQEVLMRNRLDQLLQGELKSLAQKEVRRSLPDTIGTLFSQDREEAVDTLLMQLAVGLQNQEIPVRTHAALTLAGVAEKLADSGQWQRLEKLVPALEQAILTEDMGEAEMGTCLGAVRGLVGHYLDQNQLEPASAAIHFIRRLSEGKQTESAAPAVRKQALAALNNVATKPVLNQLLEQYLHSESSREAAGQILTELGMEVSALEGAVDGNDDEFGQAGGVFADHSAREEEIFALVAQGNREQAKKELLELIGVTARAGDFTAAERLRERIYEIDSLALGEIIRSSEIIEEEKRGAIKEEDLQIWAGLTDRLTAEEFQNIYHEFSEQRYNPEEVLVSQGDRNDALFFINQGSIKVSHLAGTRELFITSLNRGQIAGENFFTPSFWTVTLTSLTPSRVYILRQETLNTWQDRFPGLRAKLHEFYRTCNNIRSMLEKKGLERRQGQRFNLSRKIQVQPINSLDIPIGRGFRAETADISQGGLGFLIRISRQENARLLLGRRMQVVLPVGGKTKYLYLKGLVIGVQPFHILENDFSVHFKFDQPMDQEGLQTILG